MRSMRVGATASALSALAKSFTGAARSTVTFSKCQTARMSMFTPAVLGLRNPSPISPTIPPYVLGSLSSPVSRSSVPKAVFSSDARQSFLRVSRLGGCEFAAATLPSAASHLVRNFRSCAPCRNLDDFFVSFPDLDAQKNPIYPAVGRAWRADELRMKSFEDLHKLWWILLKERNSLQIERHDARAKGIMIINPSRIRKVKLSMARIRVVLGERKRMQGYLKRQDRYEAEMNAAMNAAEAKAAKGEEEDEKPKFEYPESLAPKDTFTRYRPRKGAARKYWSKFAKLNPYKARVRTAAAKY